MSVRAYRVDVPAVLNDLSTFNLWRDTEVMSAIEQLDEIYLPQDLGLNGGEFELSTDQLKLLIAQKLPTYAKDAFKADLAWATKQKQDYVTYHCF